MGNRTVARSGQSLRKTRFVTRFAKVLRIVPRRSYSVLSGCSLGECLAGVGVLSTLATALVLILYACPAVDDFARGRWFPLSDWFSAVKYMYLNWSGAWASLGLDVLILPRVDLLRAYPLLLGVVFFFHVLAIYTFWRMLLAETVKRRGTCLLAAGTIAVIWAGLPDPGEAWYWFTGAVEYHLSISLAVLLVGGLVLRDGSEWAVPARGPGSLHSHCWRWA